SDWGTRSSPGCTRPEASPYASDLHALQEGIELAPTVEGGEIVEAAHVGVADPDLGDGAPAAGHLHELRPHLGIVGDVDLLEVDPFLAEEVLGAVAVVAGSRRENAHVLHDRRRRMREAREGFAEKEWALRREGAGPEGTGLRLDYIMPFMPPMPPVSFSSFGSSATMASVVSMREATEAAVCRAV